VSHSFWCAHALRCCQLCPWGGRLIPHPLLSGLGKVGFQIFFFSSSLPSIYYPDNNPPSPPPPGSIPSLPFCPYFLLTPFLFGSLFFPLLSDVSMAALFFLAAPSFRELRIRFEHPPRVFSSSCVFPHCAFAGFPNFPFPPISMFRANPPEPFLTLSFALFFFFGC